MLLIFYFPEKNISSLLLTGIHSVTATRHGLIPRLLAKGAEGGSNCDSRLYLLQLLQFYFTISQTTVKTYHRYLKFWATLDCEMILSGRQSFLDGTDPLPPRLAPHPVPLPTPRASRRGHGLFACRPWETSSSVSASSFASTSVH
jgi:hypothetical protein